jgi:titin
VAAPTVIVGSPAPPTITSAIKAAAGQIKLTFTLGTNNGSAITGQTARCVSSNGGVTNTAAHSGATAAPITVTGLTAAKLYTCTVFATNARGNGLTSAPSAAVTA